MTSPQMLLAIQIANGYGAQPGAWRMPGVDPSSYTDMDQFVRYAQAAERGKIQLVFLADTPALDVDLEREAPHHAIDPLVVLTSMARGTERIGLVATSSTTLNEPFTIARQFKALDVVSHGRAGWNAVPTSHRAAAANYGMTLPARAEKYERAHEVVQVVQALWGSWERDAWVRDVAGKRFADMSKIRPIDLQGRHVASRGPLAIPPSEQGQPVVFQAGGGANGLELAARYASGVYANPFTIEEGRAHRTALRAAAERVGRDPDEVKLFAGFMPSIAPTRRAALDRRRRLDESVDLDQRVTYLGAMLGLHLAPGRLDEPLNARELAAVRPSPADPRSARALEVAREGWSLRDVLAHGVIDYHPVVPGTAADVADHMQEWFQAGACDGFSLAIDVYSDGIDAFVDQVVPLLQERGLFHRDYEEATLRGHLGAPAQYGLDPRLAGAARTSN
ncbi:NtaA/DmoA family FMN-dependent monooxygenase [Geodermatophilus sabuli]|uniref:FMN-dependent oxidoreductase, nitrilotriacetate monooxygenase family n=1 Tax=Geodermatophilus sabuli TaxID=1564158 RepID=A0A285EAJ6_9ACTN|nr:NtaA/DmoA family FMN-dependent monooxygenase [Geodermatophilus sabuli]MBB3085513.1 FMN-dependent oxidoreductase (nitrilotriacetate monooxygenase family) [Geodermatophilus sabuli]SNX96065.1 FMN-dependent oxidoreductase, nitrilotriacetate monooxygenase family [Geodermatophilus sabuli]